MDKSGRSGRVRVPLFVIVALCEHISTALLGIMTADPDSSLLLFL